MDVLPKIANTEQRQVFNGVEVSYGIAPILSTLSDLSTMRNKPIWDVFLINVETLIRDRKEKTMDPEQIAKSVLIDATVIAQYIAAYCRFTKLSQYKQKATVIFYIPYYETLTDLLRKKLPKGTEERWKIRDRVVQLISKNGYQQQYDDTSVHFTIVGKKHFPHKDVVKDLKGLNKSASYSKALMVSHVPLDFHLYREFQEFHILESYTGKIKSQKEFGHKVFQDENIPFNKYTHLLLGDKWYVESLVTSAQKKTVKEKAASEHWKLLPDKTVLDKIISLRMVPSDKLIKPSI